jgi:hypothetical protein
MECRNDAEKRRDHLVRCVEANRLRRERFRNHLAGVCESQNAECGKNPIAGSPVNLTVSSQDDLSFQRGTNT